MTSPALRPVRARRQRGAVAIELALVVLPIMTIAVAAIEYARVVWTWDQLEQATRDAARMLAAYDPSDAEYASTLMPAARNRVVFGSNAAGATPRVPGLTTAMVRICDEVNKDTGCTATTRVGDAQLVRVEVVGYPFSPFAPLATGLGALTFGAIGTSMRQGT